MGICGHESTNLGRLGLCLAEMQNQKVPEQLLLLCQLSIEVQQARIRQSIRRTHGKGIGDILGTRPGQHLQPGPPRH